MLGKTLCLDGQIGKNSPAVGQAVEPAPGGEGGDLKPSVLLPANIKNASATSVGGVQAKAVNGRVASRRRRRRAHETLTEETPHQCVAVLL